MSRQTAKFTSEATSLQRSRTRLIFEGIGLAITSYNLANLIAGVGVSLWGVNAALMANPFVAAMTGILLLAGGFYILYQRSENFRKSVQFVWDTLGGGRVVMETIFGPIGALIGFLVMLKNNFDRVRDAAQAVLDRFSSIEKAGQSVGNIGKAVTNPVGTVSEGIANKAVSFGKKLLPGQASGGITTSAGASVVGERGPEILTLPRGARVDPLPEGGGSFGTTLVIHPGAIQVSTSDPERAAKLVVQGVQNMMARA